MNKYFFKLGKIKYLLIMCVIAISLFAGCSGNKVKTDKDGSLLYIASGDKGLVTKACVFTGSGASDNIQQVITALSESNEKAGIIGPLTLGAPVVSSRIEGQTAIIVFDQSYHRLGKIEQTLLITCLTKSITSINGIDAVSFMIGDNELKDSDGNVYVNLTSDMFVIDDDIDDISDTDISVSVYFADSNGNSLIKSIHKINYSTGNMEQELMKVLITGPVGAEGYPVINPATKINSIDVKDGQCNIDFSSDFLNQTCNVSSDVAIYSVINTLCSLDNISRVKISVNGSSEYIYQEKYDLSQIYERNQELVIK